VLLEIAIDLHSKNRLTMLLKLTAKQLWFGLRLPLFCPIALAQKTSLDTLQLTITLDSKGVEILPF